MHFLVCRNPSPYLNFYNGKVAIIYLLSYIPLSKVLHYLACRNPYLYLISLRRKVVIIYTLINLFLFNVLQSLACRSPYPCLSFFIRKISIIYMLFYYFYPILSQVLQNLICRSPKQYPNILRRNVATIYMLQNLLICFRAFSIVIRHAFYFCNLLFSIDYPVANTKRHPEKAILVKPHIILCANSFDLSCIHFLLGNSIYYFDSFRTRSARSNASYIRTYYHTHNGMLSAHCFYIYLYFYIRCL